MSEITPNTGNVLIAGASGFVGTALGRVLRDAGYAVTELTRSEPKSPSQRPWSPEEGRVDIELLDEADIVVNLAGASIAGGLWTARRKELILQSRLQSTSTLARAIARAETPPSVFISTSAVGYYGDRPGETLTEDSTPGDDFLAEVCVRWEAAANPARDAGVRVVHPRFGLVLSGDGGMLPLIKKPFQFGLGGKIGGDQHMSWIDLQDLVAAIQFLIEQESLAGPVNFVAPQSVTNEHFTRAMGEALHRPTIIPVPKAVAGFVGGELVQQLLLADQRVRPQVLADAGFVFTRPTIESTLFAAFGTDS